MVEIYKFTSFYFCPVWPRKKWIMGYNISWFSLKCLLFSKIWISMSNHHNLKPIKLRRFKLKRHTSEGCLLLNLDKDARFHCQNRYSNNFDWEIRQKIKDLILTTCVIESNRLVSSQYQNIIMNNFRINTLNIDLLRVLLVVKASWEGPQLQKNHTFFWRSGPEFIILEW